MVENITTETFVTLVEWKRNLVAHGDAREEKWRGKRRMEWVVKQSSVWLGTVHPVLLQSFSPDPHSKKSSTLLNWHPRRYKWTRPFRWKTESGFCACAITFRFHSTGITWGGVGRGRIDGVSILRLVKRVFCTLFSLYHPKNRLENISIFYFPFLNSVVEKYSWVEKVLEGLLVHPPPLSPLQVTVMASVTQVSVNVCRFSCKMLVICVWF